MQDVPAIDGYVPLIVRSRQDRAAEHVAVLIHFHSVAVWTEQLRDGFRRLHFKAADRWQRAQRPQHLF